jgi:hypothetical protein
MAYQTEAIRYSVLKQEMAGLITADKADPEEYDPAQHHFYCPDCFALGHFTRLVRIKETARGRRWYGITPAKFDLYAKTHATHKCDHPVRTREIDELADPSRYSDSYNAIPLGNHSYAWPITITAPRSKLKGIDSAERLGKVLYSCMYDPDLRQKQFFDIGSKRLPLNKIFDREATAVGHPRAAFFRANALPYIRKSNACNFEIIGTSDDALSCLDDRTYRSVRDQIDKEADGAFLVFAEAITPDPVTEKGNGIKTFMIDGLNQIFSWPHHTDFNRAISDQAEPPPPYNIPLFRAALTG